MDIILYLSIIVGGISLFIGIRKRRKVLIIIGVICLVCFFVLAIPPFIRGFIDGYSSSGDSIGWKLSKLEMHTIPGGNSTSWKRGGYFFEGGMHWLTGSGKDQPLYKEWCNLGALAEDVPVYNRDPFCTHNYKVQ